MTTSTNTDSPLAADLEPIALAAETSLRARGEHDRTAEAQAHRQLVEAAGAAMSRGRSLGEIAEAERRGHDRARSDLAKEILPRVHRAARRMRDAITDYQQVVAHAARIGVARRDRRGRRGVAQRHPHGHQDSIGRQRDPNSRPGSGGARRRWRLRPARGSQASGGVSRSRAGSATTARRGCWRNLPMPVLRVAGRAWQNPPAAAILVVPGEWRISPDVAAGLVAGVWRTSPACRGPGRGRGRGRMGPASGVGVDEDACAS